MSGPDPGRPASPSGSASGSCSPSRRGSPLPQRRSMESSSQQGGKNSRRKWTYIEECKLIEILRDIKNEGTHKGNIGFKPGYLHKIEEELKKSLPRSGIKAKPHIKSRVKNLKKDWSIVHDMLVSTQHSSSGFGFDHVRNMVYASQDVWNDYIQVHPEARQWQHKSFVHYENCCFIFGKDHATRKDAQAVADMVEEFDENVVGETPIFLVGDGLENMSASMSISDESTSIKKRKRNKSSDTLCEGMIKAAEILANQIEKASNQFNKTMGAEASEKRERIIAHLDNLTSVSRVDKLKAAAKIASSIESTDVFFSLNVTMKEEWVRLILSGEIYRD